jgi:phospholipase C
MYSESDLEGAVAAGALSPEQAARFRNYVAASRKSPVVDEEHFRLLTGFNDIFVAIAAVILLIAVSWIGQSIRILDDPGAPSPLAGLFVKTTELSVTQFWSASSLLASV